MVRKSRLQLLFSFSLIFALFSCRTMSDVDFTVVDEAIRNNEYSEAADALSSKPEYYYTKHDNVLLYLDQGLLRHFAGDFEKSNENFSLAEKEIETNFTKSISQAIGTGIINDTVQDYPGETYEDIYSNIFMCINYIHMRKFDDAIVEIKRFDNKMKLVGTEYEELLETQRKKLSENESFNVDTNVNFHNSAFARYLSLLIYRTDGDISNAELDYKKIQEAFELQKQVYDFNIPQSIQEDINPPKDKARVDFITFTGKSPVKFEIEERIYIRGAYYKKALPVMQRRESLITAIQVEMTNTETNEVYKAPLKRIESIDNVVFETYKQHFGSIYARATLRALGKSIGSGALTTGAVLSNDSDTKILLGALSLFSQVATEATERADVRICRYFPSTVCIAGITVPDGTYNVKVTYYNKSKKVVYSQILENYHAKKGELNLIESVCQK